MANPDIHVLLAQPMMLGESPLWHPEHEALYWVDIAGHAVHRFRPSSQEHRAWPVPSEPGGIAWSADDKLLVAMRSGLAFLDTSDGTLTFFADPPYDAGVIRFNDGRCDAAGRFWVGTAYDPRDQQRGDLYCVERGTFRQVGHPVTVSNGLAFSTDNRTLYHADTTAHRINAYNFDVQTGALSNGRQYMQFSADKAGGYGGRPDGAAVDTENAYWCAMYEGGRLLRISPEGEVLQEIRLPVHCPTMIAFGGADYRTLFVTTVRNKRSDEELKKFPLSGCVLTLRVDVPGRPEPAYRP